MEALDHLFVFEIMKRFEVEDHGAGTKAAKQPNPVREASHSEPAMRELPDLLTRTSVAHYLERTLCVSRPDTQVNGIILCHRFHFASHRLC
jgi:hypothetical protein